MGIKQSKQKIQQQNKERQENHLPSAIRQDLFVPPSGFRDQVQFTQDVYHLVSPQQARQYPFNCIGLLIGQQTTRPQRSVGTGFLIGPRHILTVAHNILFQKTMHRKEIIRNHKFFPFYSDLQQNNKQYKVIKYYHPKQFLQQKYDQQISNRYDYAIMILEKQIILQKYFKIESDYQPRDELLYLYGYQTKDFMEQKAILKGVKKRLIPQISSNKLSLNYRISSKGGNSGSPVFIKRNDEFIVVAIHKGSDEKSTNSGVLINHQIYNYMIGNSFFLDQQLLQINKAVSVLSPYNCIGLLITQYQQFPQSYCLGTAFLISSNLIITAACILYQLRKRSIQKHTIKTINFYIDYPSRQNNIGNSIIEFKVSQQYFQYKGQQNRRKCNFAILKLQKPIKRQKYLTLGSNFINKNEEVNICGYTVKKQFIGMKNKQCYELSNDNLLFYHNLYSNYGLAGSPIFIQKNGQTIVMAIHLGTSHDNKRKYRKYARLIDQSLIKQLLTWQHQLTSKNVISVMNLDKINAVQNR